MASNLMGLSAAMDRYHMSRRSLITFARNANALIKINGIKKYYFDAALMDQALHEKFTVSSEEK